MYYFSLVKTTLEEGSKVRKYCFPCDHAVPAFHGKQKHTQSKEYRIPSTWLELYLKQLENNISVCQPYGNLSLTHVDLMHPFLKSLVDILSM